MGKQSRLKSLRCTARAGLPGVAALDRTLSPRNIRRCEAIVARPRVRNVDAAARLVPPQPWWGALGEPTR